MTNTYKQHILNGNDNPVQQQHHVIVLRERNKPLW